VRTIKRRLTSVSGLFAYLLARGDAGVKLNPVPRGLATRRAGSGTGQRGVPLLRTPRTLPRVLAPETANLFLAALRTHRDRAMAEAMLFGGLRRCEVLGLRLRDVFPGERRVFISAGKGGHQRVVPISPRFFVSLAAYLTEERPSALTEQVFVVLKGPRRGAPLTPAGLDEIVRERSELPDGRGPSYATLGVEDRQHRRTYGRRAARTRARHGGARHCWIDATVRPLGS